MTVPCMYVSVLTPARNASLGFNQIVEIAWFLLCPLSMFINDLMNLFGVTDKEDALSLTAGGFLEDGHHTVVITMIARNFGQGLADDIEAFFVRDIPIDQRRRW